VGEGGKVVTSKPMRDTPRSLAPILPAKVRARASICVGPALDMLLLLDPERGQPDLAFMTPISPITPPISIMR
jgi:hypothetical protein